MILNNKTDLAGMGTGVLISITAWARFLIQPSDLGETILAFGFGIIFFLIFALHNNQKIIDGRVLALQEWVSDKWDEEQENLNKQEEKNNGV